MKLLNNNLYLVQKSTVMFTGGLVPNPKSKRTFSVITVGKITVCRVILRQWKTAKAPELKEWLSGGNSIFYECVLSRKSGNQEEWVSPWDRVWAYIKIEDSSK